MPSGVIEIEGLRKTFHSVRQGRRVAVDGFDLLVEAGQVHGFLGPNGSGKTTTLRALLGLVRADQGRMSVLGAQAPDRLASVAGRVGAIVESPQFFGNFTAYRTLRLLALAGGVPVSRVDEVLDEVGLGDRGHERVKGYSLGMKQRLAVASALLKRPELLILDEPANGLDPAGIREMRDLMRGLAANGVTVLLSSHILAEIQLICDHVTIISRGRRVAHGRVDEVLAGFDRNECLVRADDLARAEELLLAAGFTVTGHGNHLVVGGVPDPVVVSQILGEQGVWVRELTPLRPDLESVFLELTGTMPDPGVPRQLDFPHQGEPTVIDLDVRGADA
ncbi:ABC transporter ATP-binding protein [Micromonospora endophytica]|uniref:ABC transporter n=1 Tax=Micromonospora endophytica TaxID=515350 RepID=A0A2W2C1U0_9ACTN|nr:ATP-binding cassette domain-containing protein [Micromonospora endophytica]PZF92452.1 ABC transporter [Micromonospora endophytica]RIW44021.1 ATP-binding cassette domain-containing protein [Micromonospora endophytica]BCJ58108.1 multidrug ABC transporter ATP-binding protein [Micromonospora endophytica]